MTNLTVLHVSDLHFDRSQVQDIRILRTALLDDLHRLADEGLRPDIIAFSGDMVASADEGYGQDCGDYEAARDEFIIPLLSACDLSTDQFFFCPGNHDIQRSRIDEFTEEGLKARLVDRKTVNAFLDSYEQNPTRYAAVFDRMSNYERFKQALPNRHIRKNGVLVSTFAVELAQFRIGIACFSSVWRAYGGKADYGELLLGERVLDSAIDDLAGCAIKIGIIHHPFSWLKEFERTELRRRAVSGFDFWLQGHAHEHDAEIPLLRAASQPGAVIVSAGALYHSREFWNGYSIIRYSVEDRAGMLYLREYFDRGRQFVAASTIGDDGKITFALPQAQNAIAPSGLSMRSLDAIREHVSSIASQQLLPSATSQSLMLTDLEAVFVEPVLSVVSWHAVTNLSTRKQRDEAARCLSDLLQTRQNLVFVGGPESGKTTLLNHICTKYLTADAPDQPRIPFLINPQSFPKGKNKVLTEIRRYLANCGIDYDPEPALKQGSCVLLIDDLDLRDKKAVTAIADFARAYPENRYLFTASDKQWLERFDLPPDLGVKYETIYLHPFGRRQVRQLVEKWFAEDGRDAQADELPDTVLQRIAEISLPCTPAVVTLLLTILSQQEDYIPVSKAALMERLMEILLDSMSPVRAGSGMIDYRIYEDFLAHLTKVMVESGRSIIELEKLHSTIRTYFAIRGLPVPGSEVEFAENLIRRGILVSDNGIAAFRYKGFRAYFFAKALIDDPMLREQVTAEDRYLHFADSLEYMTGLQRKSKDLIAVVAGRTQKLLQKLLDDFGVMLELGHYDNIAFRMSTLDSLAAGEREVVIAKLRQSRLAEEEKDHLYQYRTSIRPEDDFDERGELEHSEPEWNDGLILLENILLLASLIRNSDLVDDKEFKKLMVRECLGTVLKLVYVLTLRAEEKIKKMPDEDINRLTATFGTGSTSNPESSNADGFRESGNYAAKVMLFLLSEGLLGSVLATPRLQIVLSEEIANAQNHVVLRLLLTMLYLDLRLPGYLDKVDSITREVIDRDFYRELLLIKLRTHYSLRQLTQGERQRLENLVADIAIAVSKAPAQRKAEILGQLRRAGLLAQMGSERAMEDGAL